MGEHATRADGPPVAPVLQVDQVEFSYGAVPVLFGVSLEVGAGEAVALLGTNGAGKSTLLRVVAGLERPSAGRVLFQGRDVGGVPAEDLVRRGVVLVRGGRGVFPDLTVAENFALQGLSLARRSFDARRARVLEVFASLAGHLQQRAGTLSGGERQQLVLAKALLLEPALLCVDELSLGLSPAAVEELLELVGAVVASGTGVLLVEQSIQLAAVVCERAVFLDRGEVRFTGPTRSLLDRPDLASAVFFSQEATT